MQVNEEQNIGGMVEDRKTSQGVEPDDFPKSLCSLCGAEMNGGLWTNGDGYGDGKHVGIVPPEFAGFCWDCVKSRNPEVPELSAQIDAAFAAHGFCGFLEAWIGRCRNPQPCEKHINEVCASCGARAIRNCSQTGQFVCGAPLCAECEHAIFPSGTNGGVGFNQEELPEDMKRHCNKSKQKYQPWHARPISDHPARGQASKTEVQK